MTSEVKEYGKMRVGHPNRVAGYGQMRVYRKSAYFHSAARTGANDNMRSYALDVACWVFLEALAAKRQLHAMLHHAGPPADKRQKHATQRLGTPHAEQLYFYIYETHLFMKYLPFAEEH